MDFIISLSEHIMNFIDFVLKKENLSTLTSNMQIATSVTLSFGTILKIRTLKKIKDDMKKLKLDLAFDRIIRVSLMITVLASAIRVVYLGIAPGFFLILNLIVQFIFVEIISGFNARMLIMQTDFSKDLENVFNSSFEGLKKKDDYLVKMTMENENLKRTIKELKGEENER